MDEWLAIMGVVVAVAVVLEVLTFYGPFANDFTKERYRKVAGVDHAAPVLELVLIGLLALAILVIANWVFPDRAQRVLEDDLGMPWSLAIPGLIAVIAGLTVFKWSPEEAKELLRHRGSFDDLHPKTQADLKDLIEKEDEDQKTELVRLERKNGVFYLGVGTIIFTLAALLLGLVVPGLWSDFTAARSARGALGAAAPVVLEPFSEVYRQLEGYYAAFRDYETELLDLALDLTAVLAVVFVLTFYVLGTMVYTIYTVGAQRWARSVASLVVFFLLPALIAVTYLNLVGANRSVTDTLGRVTAEIDIGDLNNEEVASFHDLEDRLRSHVDLPGFWSRLATSSGGFLLLAGAILAVWQSKRSPASFLRSIVPRSIIRSYRKTATGRLELMTELLTPHHDVPDDRLAKAMRHAAVAITSADGRVLDHEKAYAISIITELSSRPYGLTDFEDDLESLRTEGLERAFVRVAGRLDDTGKEQLVVRCLRLAAVDGDIADAEVSEIERASMALGMSPAHFRSIVTAQRERSDSSVVQHDLNAMKAIVYRRYGSPDVLELRQADTPVVDDDDVLVKVHAASVNPYDWHYVTGLPYVSRLEFGLAKPKIPGPGADVAGRVEAVGHSVKRFRYGDEVFGETDDGGTFAEYAVLPESGLVTKPANLTFEQAAAVPMASLTALQGLRKGRIREGQQVLVNGASGGVGTFAVQLASWFGAQVTGVCSTKNTDLVRSLGAAHVVDYTRDDFTRGDRRYDLILDLVGNHRPSRCRRVLNRDGVYVASFGRPDRVWFGPMTRLIGLFALAPFVSQKLTVFRQRVNVEDLDLVRELIEAGKVTPVIDRSYPLSEVPDAIRYLGGGHARGKVVITV